MKKCFYLLISSEELFRNFWKKFELTNDSFQFVGYCDRKYAFLVDEESKTQMNHRCVNSKHRFSSQFCAMAENVRQYRRDVYFFSFFFADTKPILLLRALSQTRFAHTLDGMKVHIFISIIASAEASSHQEQR